MSKKKHMLLPSLWEQGGQDKIIDGLVQSGTASMTNPAYEKLYESVSVPEQSTEASVPEPDDSKLQTDTDGANPEKPTESPDYVSQALELLTTSSREPYTPGEYVSPYTERLDSLINDILGSSYGGYNAQKDNVFRQYKKQYLREADRTQQNVLGQYAALTGGSPSSAAIAAASQAGGQLRGELADILPQLAEADYEKYLSGLDAKRSQLSDLLSLEKLSYGKFSDEENRRLAAWEQKGQLANDQIYKLLQAIELLDSREDREISASDREYGRMMDRLLAGIMPSNEQLEQFGISSDDANKFIKYFATVNSQNKTGNTEDAEVTYENALEYLKEMGITNTDGLMNEEQFEAWNRKYGSYASYEDYVFDFIYQLENN